MLVTAMLLNGKTLNVECKPEERCSVLYASISEQLDVPEHMLRLVNGVMLLQKDETTEPLLKVDKIHVSIFPQEVKWPEGRTSISAWGSLKILREHVTKNVNPVGATVRITVNGTVLGTSEDDRATLPYPSDVTVEYTARLLPTDTVGTTVRRGMVLTPDSHHAVHLVLPSTIKALYTLLNNVFGYDARMIAVEVNGSVLPTPRDETVDEEAAMPPCAANGIDVIQVKYSWA
jgi:hypothetical protein